jgi:hypothetical protein
MFGSVGSSATALKPQFDPTPGGVMLAQVGAASSGSVIL